MRTMHAAKVGRGTITRIHNDNIQNVEVLALLKHLETKTPSADKNELLAQIPFFSSTRPDIVQSGHEVIGLPQYVPSRPYLRQLAFQALIDQQVSNMSKPEFKLKERTRLEQVLNDLNLDPNEASGAGFDVIQDLRPRTPTPRDTGATIND